MDAASRSRLDALGLAVAALPDPVRLIDVSGRLLAANEAARALGTDALGHLCGTERGVPPSSCPACQLRVSRETAVFRRWHVAVPRAGRRDDYYEVTLCPLRDEGGRPFAVLEMLRDATATIGLEQYLIDQSETQDLEIVERTREADDLKSRLGVLEASQLELLYRDRLAALSRIVASLSHEIHTPLGALMSSADLIQRGLPRLRKQLEGSAGDADAAQFARRFESLATAAGVVSEGGRRIQSIVRSLRVFTRLDEAPLKQADLEEGLNSTIELLEYRLEDRIVVERDYGGLALVTCRPDACNQVFMNLLLNAIQAIGGEGTIRVSTRLEGSWAVISVADDGVGIPEAERERIFQLGFTTRGGTGGSGTGLALSKRIVEEHGGQIEVAPRPSGGTIFTVRLPVEPPREKKS